MIRCLRSTDRPPQTHDPPLALTNESIKSVSIVDAIEGHLKTMIVNGELKPGQKLPSERELQDSLGVSRLPLREALARLQALGLIQIRHGKGSHVVETVSKTALSDVLIAFFPHQNSDRLRELVEARGLVESELSALASKRRHRGRFRATGFRGAIGQKGGQGSRALRRA